MAKIPTILFILALSGMMAAIGYQAIELFIAYANKEDPAYLTMGLIVTSFTLFFGAIIAMVIITDL